MLAFPYIPRRSIVQKSLGTRESSSSVPMRLFPDSTHLSQAFAAAAFRISWSEVRGSRSWLIPASGLMLVRNVGDGAQVLVRIVAVEGPVACAVRSGPLRHGA